MTFLDSSVVIDQLDGEEAAVEYVRRRRDRARTNPMVLYEVLEGEVFTRGEARLDELRDRLAWLDVVPVDDDVAMTAATLQAERLADWQPLAARDAIVAAHAKVLDDPLATADADDFDVASVRSDVDIEVVSER